MKRLLAAIAISFMLCFTVVPAEMPQQEQEQQQMAEEDGVPWNLINTTIAGGGLLLAYLGYRINKKRKSNGQ